MTINSIVGFAKPLAFAVIFVFNASALITSAIGQTDNSATETTDAATSDAVPRQAESLSKPGSSSKPGKPSNTDIVDFKSIDTDSNDWLSRDEIKAFIRKHRFKLQSSRSRFFRKLDKDNNEKISESEFNARYAAIAPYPDPGKSFAPFPGLTKPTNDRKVFGAIYHRYFEHILDRSIQWNATAIDDVPKSVQGAPPNPGPAVEATVSETIDRLAQSTVILVGRAEGDMTFAGGVLISKDGLAITCFHVAGDCFNDKMLAVTANGKCHQVVEILAGDPKSDVALIRLAGDNFPHVDIAQSTPRTGDPIQLVHHSESRFYTFDRGFVKRYPHVDGTPWMEISADYAPGGSGCGVFNEKGQLVGLVSIICSGDGPTLGEDNQGSIWDQPDGILLVKHATPLSAIHSLWKQPPQKPEKN